MRSIDTKGAQKFPQKVVPLGTVFIVILSRSVPRFPTPKSIIIIIIAGLWIVWAGTLLVAVHTIHRLNEKTFDVKAISVCKVAALKRAHPALQVRKTCPLERSIPEYRKKSQSQ